MKVISKLVGLLTLTIFITACGDFFTASTAICKSSKTDTSYCKYEGKIEQVYVNSQGLTLVYLKESFDKQQAEENGLSIKHTNVLAYQQSEKRYDQQFWELFKLALEQDLDVEIHTRNTFKGYLVIDRIWVKGK